LAGLGGNDTLNGGAGNDTYLLGVGDGKDVIVDSAGTDTVRFGSGIAPSGISAFHRANDLVVAWNAGERVTVSGWFPGNKIEQFVFTGGATLSAAEMEARIVATPPALANALPDQAATEDSAFSFAVPANTFADPDVNDSLSFSATRAD